MNKNKVGLISCIMVLIVLIQPVNMSSSSSTSSVTIKGAGSTFAQVVLDYWANEYTKTTDSGFKLAYGGGGSGQGIASILNLSVNFGASDAPLSTSQQLEANTNANANGHSLGKINTLPDSAGGIVLAYNLQSGINGALNLTSENIAGIYQRTITSWNDSSLRANNPGLTSNASIIAVHRSEASGTTYAFTDYLTRSTPTTWKLGKGTTIDWPASTKGSQGNTGVANTITGTANSIGYVELAYALQKNIKSAYIRNKDGYWVNATLQGITNAVNTATAGLPDSSGDWSSVSINDESGATTYPICTLTYLFIYGNLSEYGVVGQSLINFLKYIMSPSAQESVSSLGYVPLPSSLLLKNLDVINAIEVSLLTTTQATSNTPSFNFTSVIVMLVGISFIELFKNKRRL